MIGKQFPNFHNRYHRFGFVLLNFMLEYSVYLSFIFNFDICDFFQPLDNGGQAVIEQGAIIIGFTKDDLLHQPEAEQLSAANTTGPASSTSDGNAHLKSC